MGWAAAISAFGLLTTPGPQFTVDRPVVTVWWSPSAAITIGQPQTWPRLSTATRRRLVGRIETQALMGDRLVVTEQRPDGWARILLRDQPTPKDPLGYPGWIRLINLGVTGALDPTTTVVTAKVARVHTRPYETVQVSYGTRLGVDRRGRVWTSVGVPSVGVGRIASSAVASRPPATRAAIVADARRFIGVRYLWGGMSAYGFDCSGLVHFVFRTHGIRIPRDADAQAEGGKPVARAALRPGDLVFYGVTHVHHVALYVGGGKMLEAPNSASSVRIAPLRLADYAGARRYLP